MRIALLLVVVLGCGEPGVALSPRRPLVPVHAEAPQGPPAPFRLISTGELRARLSGQGEPLWLFDARSREEYEEYHLPSARLLPASRVAEELDALGVGRDDELVFYCNGPNCTKSARAAKAAAALHYRRVTEYRDGMPAWAQARLSFSGTPLPCPVTRALTPAELEVWLAEGKGAVVDVRDAAEFARFHLRGAINVPLDELRRRAGQLEALGPLVLVDHSGHQRAVAARVLASVGVGGLLTLEGGLLAWQQQGKSLELGDAP